MNKQEEEHTCLGCGRPAQVTYVNFWGAECHLCLGCHEEKWEMLVLREDPSASWNGLHSVLRGDEREERTGSSTDLSDVREDLEEKTTLA